MIILTNHKAIRLIRAGMLLVSLLMAIPETAFSQEDSAAQHKLSVGVMVAPPVYMKTADNRWMGFGIEIWQ
ncbi:MAG: hypothetical protein P8X90_13800, partial [Desulfobacterales bacterium]